jgi:DNA-binding NarL/FixJ family response regulator
MSGIAALPHFRTTVPEAKIIMLKINDDRALITKAIERGAYGYVLKSAGLAEVARAVRAAAQGKRYLDPDVLTIFLEGLAREEPELAGIALSPREIEVLRCIADGDSRVAIARRLGLSVGTVIAHQRAIHQKLRVNKSTEAVAKAIRQRLL